ncbi:uncharacterized protein LOC129570915 isoform X2 [Sitodiplosis mosellana]|uniref:uncharacterized protein LOC129570915 isoform X2 n=1 Tax=Sitodiplosis mosellana TaxID=263140 RepID=UPI0024445CD9|nr:uncharacterized protein LOC129570915 isoform X2 [Sitodiplosis mosellana]
MESAKQKEVLLKRLSDANRLVAEEKERQADIREDIRDLRRSNYQTIRQHDENELRMMLSSSSTYNSLRRCVGVIVSTKGMLHRLKNFDQAEKQMIDRHRRELNEISSKFDNHVDLGEETTQLDDKIANAEKMVEQRKKELAQWVKTKESFRRGSERKKVDCRDKMSKQIDKRSEVKLRLMNAKMERSVRALMAKLKKK